MPAVATKPFVRLRAHVVEEEVVMVRADVTPVKRDKNLYVTAGAMFAGLLGVFLFAAPGGVIGAAAGALAGLLFVQHRPAA